MAKKTVIKYNIICGSGVHRSYTACLAEIIMLNKYGNQQDYFWRESRLYAEYVKLIKLAGRISKEVGSNRLAWFLYKNPGYQFDDDIGLFIYNLRDDDSLVDFTLAQLVTVYTNKYRPVEVEIEIEKEIATPKKNKKLTDFLGDI